MTFADVAQAVAHLIGSEEVTGPSPVISSLRKLKAFNLKGLRAFVFLRKDFFSIFLIFFLKLFSQDGMFHA